jgi:hypothetical protein
VSRFWTEAVAALADIFGGVPMMIVLSFLGTLIIALLWYFWPHWLPWRWRLWSYLASWGRRSRTVRSDGGRRRFRLGMPRWRLRWRRRKKKRAEATPDEELPPDVLPDLPAEVLALTADQLAAAGRYAEAVRERLRAIVRDLIEREVIPFRPGWTVTELAASAAQARPHLATPMQGATDVFSEIWYGLRPARQDDDLAMRGHARAIVSILDEPVPAGRSA